jgi:hypothetical protein
MFKRIFLAAAAIGALVIAAALPTDASAHWRHRCGYGAYYAGPPVYAGGYYPTRAYYGNPYYYGRYYGGPYYRRAYYGGYYGAYYRPGVRVYVGW